MNKLFTTFAILVLGVSLCSAQNNDRAGNADNAQIPVARNDAAPRDRNWGWIGLLGLAGLGGLRGRRRESEYVSGRDRNVGDVRRAA